MEERGTGDNNRGKEDEDPSPLPFSRETIDNLGVAPAHTHTSLDAVALATNDLGKGMERISYIYTTMLYCFGMSGSHTSLFFLRALKDKARNAQSTLDLCV